jgi:hypothetical protein
MGHKGLLVLPIHAEAQWDVFKKKGKLYKPPLYECVMGWFVCN